MKDYYYILGIERDADSISVKLAYRKLSLKFHPDKNDGDKFFEERFKEIQEAYEVLSNQQNRIDYDRILKDIYDGNSNNQSSKEEELRRQEEELKRKYQTPDKREKEFKAQQAKKKAEEEAMLRQEILKYEAQLTQKEKELSKANEEQKRINSEIAFFRIKISELKGKKNDNTSQNQEKYQKEKFAISNFPKLQQDLNKIKEYIAAYDFQAFMAIFIQFTKKHSIDIHLTNKHKQLVDIVINEKVPIKETERLFRLYKDNTNFVNALETEIIRTLK